MRQAWATAEGILYLGQEGDRGLVLGEGRGCLSDGSELPLGGHTCTSPLPQATPVLHHQGQADREPGREAVSALPHGPVGCRPPGQPRGRSGLYLSVPQLLMRPLPSAGPSGSTGTWPTVCHSCPSRREASARCWTTLTASGINCQMSLSSVLFCQSWASCGVGPSPRAR